MRTERAKAIPGVNESSDARVIVYATRWCGYCAAAEELLQVRGIRYQRIEVGGDPATRQWLRQTTNRSTVPQIFIDGRSIGGYTALAALDDSGELAELLDRPPP